MLQKGDNVRFLLQRGLAAAGMLYGRVGRLILVFMINGREYRTGRPGFHPFIDQESASPVQMPPVRQNDQMVQFDGRQDEPLGVRLLNEPVAEFLRGSGVCHAEMGCLHYKRPQVFLNTKSACGSGALAVGIGKWLCRDSSGPRHAASCSAGGMPENMAQVVLAGRVPEVPLSRAAPGDVLPLPEISGSGRVHGSGVAFRGREDCQRERKRALRTTSSGERA